MDANQQALQYLKDYAKEVSRLFNANYTEHTFRGSLQVLLNNLLPQYKAINEPQRTECGAPDYALLDSQNLPHAYIEAKNLFDKDLIGTKEHKEQFDRYKSALPRIAFTDYLEFHFYCDGELVATVHLLKESPKGGFEIADAEKFVSTLQNWSDSPIQPITTAKRLAEVMAGKARLLNEAIVKTMRLNPASTMHDQYGAFRENLLRDLTIDDFADHFAQTVVYGMFAAKTHHDRKSPFTRITAAQLVPISNPLLRELFQYLAGFNVDGSISWIVDDLADAFNATDIDKVLGKYTESEEHSDPLIYFYEDFLSAYDPNLKEIRGVYYTPLPVVSFIVRAIDEILRRDFKLSDGLADSSKIEYKNQQLHRVQILDPATGTGTFLAETVKLIKKKYEGNDGMWKGYVDNHLRPRLHGFELLMAPYTIAHLKLDLLMQSDNTAQSRLKVYLTNSLMDTTAEAPNLFFTAIAKEVKESNAVKNDLPIMVMMGNPPYAVSSANKDRPGVAEADKLFGNISRLLNDYKANLIEKKINLDDDYIKFIRLCQYYIDKNGSGVFGVITNNSYLYGLTHRRMRESLLTSFDHIYIINLHGNSRTKETCPDGSRDDNVFDIMAGVAIAIFVKKGNKKSMAKVHYIDLYGQRRNKHAALDATSIKNGQWQTLTPTVPNFFFTPKDFSMQKEYEKGIKLNELLEVHNSGVESMRDSVNIFFDDEERLCVLNDFKTLQEHELRNKYGLAKDGRDWKVAFAQKDLKGNKIICTKMQYRPFDYRFINYTGKTKGIMGYPRFDTMRHLISGDNIGLIIKRGFDNPKSAVGFCSNVIIERRTWTRPGMQGAESVFPLYRYTPNGEKELNIKEEILQKAIANVGGNAETFFAYIYAVLHSPSYREKYKEFLKIDFPTIPIPEDKTEYERLAKLGQKLIDMHTKVDGGKRSALPKYPVAGTDTVDAIRYDRKCVYINSSQYFENVPESAWKYFVGGYQPAQKWLKDRKGRKLRFEEIEHYQRLISVIVSTEEVMEEIG